MNTILWIVQGILAAMYLMAGSMKTSQPKEKLVKMGLEWTGRFPISTVRFIGSSELLGAAGLILPLALGIAPLLTPVAASGLALMMLLATIHHLKHKESGAAVFTVILMLAAVFVAWGRFA